MTYLLLTEPLESCMQLHTCNEARAAGAYS